LLICPSRCCVVAGDATSSLRATRLTRRAANLHPPLEGAARSAAEGAHRPRGRTAIPPGSIAIRHAVEHRAARSPRIARVLHRHHARALADEHALPDGDRRSVADDHARMRRGEVRARAVALDDCVARKHPAAAVIAGHVHTRPGAALRQRRAGGAGCDRGHDHHCKCPNQDAALHAR